MTLTAVVHCLSVPFLIVAFSKQIPGVCDINALWVSRLSKLFCSKLGSLQFIAGWVFVVFKLKHKTVLHFAYFVQ